MHQTLEGGRVERVVARLHPGVGFGGSSLQGRLVGVGQSVKLLGIDLQGQGSAALVPARVVVELGDLGQAQLLVVGRHGELGGVNGALFERGVDVAGRQLLRHYAQLGQHLAAHAASAELEALKVGGGIELLLEEATHLRAGVASQQADHA